MTTIDVDRRKSFTLFEACPEARCRDPLGAPAPDLHPLGPRPKCGGERGWVKTFNSLAELQRYAADPPSW
jgi:hypothetical protein